MMIKLTLGSLLLLGLTITPIVLSASLPLSSNLPPTPPSNTSPTLPKYVSSSKPQPESLSDFYANPSVKRLLCDFLKFNHPMLLEWNKDPHLLKRLYGSPRVGDCSIPVDHQVSKEDKRRLIESMRTRIIDIRQVSSNPASSSRPIMLDPLMPQLRPLSKPVSHVRSEWKPTALLALLDPKIFSTFLDPKLVKYLPGAIYTPFKFKDSKSRVAGDNIFHAVIRVLGAHFLRLQLIGHAPLLDDALDTFTYLLQRRIYYLIEKPLETPLPSHISLSPSNYNEEDLITILTSTRHALAEGHRSDLFRLFQLTFRVHAKYTLSLLPEDTTSWIVHLAKSNQAPYHHVLMTPIVRLSFALAAMETYYKAPVDPSSSLLTKKKLKEIFHPSR
ncbi:MAG: hypothetical protein DHS80DRAFT_28770 [Piptocephalis tieghemiana]|nr:MAG: hypothetical protein DHS80DRAFT_28770 [Piptocephalis tieghemiana]